MTNEELIHKFNPAGSEAITPEDIEVLRALTDDQINVLAQAYPNQPTRKSYLRLYDKNLPADKQMYNLSTWQNLNNVRKFHGLKNLVPWEFFTVSQKFVTPSRPAAKAGSSPRKVTVDLGAQEAADELRKSVGTKEVTTIESKVPPVKSSAAKGKGGKKGLSVPTNDDQESASGTVPEDQQFGTGE